jgi:hypothetical protein
MNGTLNSRITVAPKVRCPICGEKRRPWMLHDHLVRVHKWVPEGTWT